MDQIGLKVVEQKFKNHSFKKRCLKIQRGVEISNNSHELINPYIRK